MIVWILGFDINILGVFALKEDAMNYAYRTLPNNLEHEFDEDGNWEGYWVESWDVI